MKFFTIAIVLCVFVGAFAAEKKRNYGDYDDSDVRVVPNLAVQNSLTVGQGNKQVQIANGGIEIGGVPFQGPAGPAGPTGPRGPRGPRGHDGSHTGKIHSVQSTINGALSAGDEITFESGIDLQVGTQVLINGNYYVITSASDDDNGAYTYTAQLESGSGLSGALGAAPTAGSDISVVGGFGPAGPQGPQGALGPQGPQGPQGAQGPQGPIGPVGAQGPAGPAGQKGERGHRGRRGHDGFKGDPGLQGPQGAQGVQGPKGIQGETGPQGPAGPTGSQGPQGAPGQKGERGHHGRDGYKGEKGAEGIAGPQGPEGPQGPVGPAGPQGPAGPKGDAFTFQTYTDTYSYFLPSVSSNSTHYGDFTYYASQDTTQNFNIYSNLYVKLGNNPVSPPQNNRNLNSLAVESYSKSCPAGTTLVDGSCAWNLFTYEKRPSWCRASDFPPGAPGCVNCVVRVDSVHKRFFDGSRDVPVVRRLTVADGNGKIESVALNGYSCKIVNLFELSDQEVSSCGFFCFFHDIETIHLQENTLTCRYIPPQNIASALGLGSSVSTSAAGFNGKVSVVSVQVACQ